MGGLGTLFAICLVLATCQEPRRVGEEADGVTSDDPAAEGLVSLTVGDAKIWVEVAGTEDDRARGLMFRDSMAWNRGMIFLYPRDRILSFWMKNTRIPLSIAFIANNGRIVEIRDMKPFDETSIFSELPGRYALEANAGWFEKSGVGVGDRVVGLSSLPPGEE